MTFIDLDNGHRFYFIKDLPKTLQRQKRPSYGPYVKLTSKTFRHESTDKALTLGFAEVTSLRVTRVSKESRR